MKRLIVILTCFFCIQFAFAQTVVFNELVSKNSSIIQDMDGDYSDFIELYNPNNSTIELNGYSLSDELSYPRKWICLLYTSPSPRDRG